MGSQIVFQVWLLVRFLKQLLVLLFQRLHRTVPHRHRVQICRCARRSVHLIRGLVCTIWVSICSTVKFCMFICSLLYTRTPSWSVHWYYGNRCKLSSAFTRRIPGGLSVVLEAFHINRTKEMMGVNSHDGLQMFFIFWRVRSAGKKVTQTVAASGTMNYWESIIR